MIHAGIDEAAQTIDAVLHRAASGPDLHTLTGEVLLIVGVEKSFCFAKGLIAIAVYRHAVIQGSLEGIRIAPFFDQHLSQPSLIILKHRKLDLIAHPTVGVTGHAPERALHALLAD